tara:strand:- start:497 stop:682 length:186 start_codon:yes stop_codon:yes gene_type:complete
MDFVQPKQIMSPYSGRMVTPRIVEHDRGDEIHVEAQWYCPSSGEFLQKGLVEIRQKQAPEE